MPSRQKSTRLDTRAKLLEVAGQVFAQVGFRAATVQEICERAGANIAAVNYHFRDKLGLYTEVLRHAHESARERQTLHANSHKLSAEQRLELFIHKLLRHLFGDSKPSWFAQVMAHELAEPTPALKQLVEQEARPGFEELKKLVRTIIGARVADDVTVLCANSIVGQCVHYFHSRPVIAELWPDLRMTEERIDQLAAHITTFSLYALKQISNNKIGAQKRRQKARDGSKEIRARKGQQ